MPAFGGVFAQDQNGAAARQSPPARADSETLSSLEVRVRALQQELVVAQAARIALDARREDSAAARHHEALLRITYESALQALSEPQRRAAEMQFQSDESRLLQSQQPSLNVTPTTRSATPGAITKPLRPFPRQLAFACLIALVLAGLLGLAFLAIRRRRAKETAVDGPAVDERTELQVTADEGRTPEEADFRPPVEFVLPCAGVVSGTSNQFGVDEFQKEVGAVWQLSPGTEGSPFEAVCRDAIYSVLLNDWGAGIRSYGLLNADSPSETAGILAHMAVSLGRVGLRVVLIDADAEQQPTLAATLGAAHPDAASIAQTDFPNVSVLTLERGATFTPEAEFPALMERLTSTYDLVLARTAPDAVITERLLKACGGCVILHASNATASREAITIQQRLSQQGHYVAAMLRLDFISQDRGKVSGRAR